MGKNKTHNQSYYWCQPANWVLPCGNIIEQGTIFEIEYIDVSKSKNFDETSTPMVFRGLPFQKGEDYLYLYKDAMVPDLHPKTAIDHVKYTFKEEISLFNSYFRSVRAETLTGRVFLCVGLRCTETHRSSNKDPVHLYLATGDTSDIVQVPWSNWELFWDDYQ